MGNGCPVLPSVNKVVSGTDSANNFVTLTLRKQLCITTTQAVPLIHWKETQGRGGTKSPHLDETDWGTVEARLEAGSRGTNACCVMRAARGVLAEGCVDDLVRVCARRRCVCRCNHRRMEAARHYDEGER